MADTYIELNNKCESEDTKVQNFLEKKQHKEWKHSIFVRICLTVLLVICISIVWLSLMSPLVVGYLTQYSTANISRPYFDLLNKNNLNKYNKCNVSNTTIVCPSNFVYNYNSCVPICGKWHPFGDTYFKAYRYSVTTISLLSLIFSVLGLIVLIPVKNSFYFPKFFYFVMFSTLIALSCVLTGAALAGPHSLFCGGRNEDFNLVANDPPIAVTLLGIISHYSYIAFQLSFCVAVFNIFVVIYFPAIMFSVRKKRCLIITELIVCLGVPAFFPIINIAVYRQYSFIRLPILPFPLADRIAPFALALGPLLILTGIMSTLILLSIYRVQVLKYMIYKEIVKFKSYEIRMIIFGIESLLTVLFIFIELALTISTDEIVTYLQEEYFACTTLQHNSMILSNSTLTPTQCPALYQPYMHPIVSIIADMLTGIAAVQMWVILCTHETGKPWKLCLVGIWAFVKRLASVLEDMHVNW
ncbi:hypothetical protein LOD99_1913 [Oopsacas minuta]|uniref:Uncharacterized protein n=1 Tax=Oopsacas minuta TaxID=111878 RepID=A0AAV7K4G1_9METZ|nr:hypothetical protein LOD99_1913 [Oopsacas minuta]